ncbi:MAG: protein translocase subunit SecD [Porticoccaceae bacterium]
MNRYPLWKYLLILCVAVWAFVYALPNLYAPDPAIQLTGQSGALQIDQATLDKATAALDAVGIAHFGQQVSGGSGLIRLRDREQQLAGKRLVQEALGLDHVVALNLAPTTPDWLVAIGAKPMKLGLDLSGGVHFLLEVDTAKVVAVELESRLALLKEGLREQGARYKSLRIADGNAIIAGFDKAAMRDQAAAVLKDKFSDLLLEPVVGGEQYQLKIILPVAMVRQKEDYAVGQNLTTLRNRVNELGVSEPIVQRQGRNRIIVELPGVQDTAEAKRIIGKTANLEFRLEAQPGSLGGREEFAFRDPNARPATAWLEKKVVITGDRVTNASASFDENGLPQVNITLDGSGGEAMNYATRKNIGRKLGVLFIESKARLQTRINAEGVPETTAVNYEDKKIISLATVQSALGVQFRITGLDSPQESSELALLLRAGALAAPMYFVEERTIGPSLGAKNIDSGIRSMMIGVVLVVVFMVVYYRVFGLFADMALMMNLVLLVAAMSLIEATLTLPGIAGIVLTMGMAVDANVLIYARIREELKNGLPIQAAIHAGYDRANVSILDANLTTLIVGVILYAVGTGPVQGFAVTLSIGIATSMFTAIMGTRALTNLTFGGRNLKKLWI